MRHLYTNIEGNVFLGPLTCKVGFAAEISVLRQRYYRWRFGGMMVSSATLPTASWTQTAESIEITREWFGCALCACRSDMPLV